MGFQRRQKPTSIAFYGVQACRLPALKPSKPLKPLKGHFNGFLWASSAGKSPHPWLFLGVQACRLPGLKPSKPLKPLKGHFNGFLWASSAGKVICRFESLVQLTCCKWDMYPPTPAVAIARGSARDSEASAAACSPSLAGSSGADGATTSYPSKARSVPQCHAASVWKNVHFLAFWLAFEICFYSISGASKWATTELPFEKLSVLHCHAVKTWRGCFFPSWQLL